MFSRASCGAIQPLLWEYGEGNLSDPAQKARVEAHLQTCRRCQRDAAAYQHSADAFQLFAAAQPSPTRPPQWAAIEARLHSAEAPAFLPLKSRRRPAATLALLGRGAAGVAAAVAAGALWNAEKGMQRVTEMPPADAPSSAITAAASPAVGASSVGAVTSGTYLAATADKKITLTAEPCFLLSNSAPLVVTVKNNGPSVTGELVTKPANYGFAVRTYRQPVSLPGAGAISRFIVYPKLNDYPNNTAVTVSLVGAFESLTTSTVAGVGGYSDQQIGYIGKGIGLLKPAKDVPRPRQQRYYTDNLKDCYAVPVNAPDRAVGYEGLRFLALGKGAEELNPRQWKAIRDWVKEGGSLILLGGNTMAYLQTPEARELLNGMMPAAPLSVNTQTWPYSTTRTLPDFAAKERTLGVGKILLLNFDPTMPGFRHWSELPLLWNKLTDYARAPVPLESLRYSSLSSAPWMDQPNAAARRAYLPQNEINPFEIKLPPLRTILYVFLGYFLLAIPVTFITLKRLRRMNLAWATGPLLAIVFAGGLYLFTAELYNAKMSRRTTGVLVMTAGEREGRFIGYSEVFFPRAGRYDVAVPHAETVEISGVGLVDAGEGRHIAADVQFRATLRDLETVDNGEAVSVPALQVNTLAFRRLYHEQPVTLGAGITATLRKEAATGRIVGVINNQSGRTVSSAYLCLGSRSVWKHLSRHEGRSDYFLTFAALGDLPPGETAISAIPKEISLSHESGLSPFLTMIGQLTRRQGASPLALVGETTGSDLGPHLGQWVGGANSVQVIVALNPLEKGGAK